MLPILFYGACPWFRVGALFFGLPRKVISWLGISTMVPKNTMSLMEANLMGNLMEGNPKNEKHHETPTRHGGFVGIFLDFAHPPRGHRALWLWVAADVWSHHLGGAAVFHRGASRGW